MSSPITILRSDGSIAFTASLESKTVRDAVVEAVNGGADLSNADLMVADLRGADLSGAHLMGAYLMGADLIDAGQESRGFRWVATPGSDGRILLIQAGCQRKTLAEARNYWGDGYTSNGDLAEIKVKIDYLESEAKRRGWIE